MRDSADELIRIGETLASTSRYLAAKDAVRELLRALDVPIDENTQETPARVARMYVREAFAGLYQPRPRMTSFPNGDMDQLYVVGPVAVRSTCAHHLAPIMGRAWLGILPSGRVLGLSKFARLTRWVMARPQIQEGATIMLADEIEKVIEPRGLAVVVKAEHLCMTWRGVMEHETKMTTSVMRGAMRENAALRAEFLGLLRV